MLLLMNTKFSRRMLLLQQAWSLSRVIREEAVAVARNKSLSGSLFRSIREFLFFSRSHSSRESMPAALIKNIDH